MATRVPSKRHAADVARKKIRDALADEIHEASEQKGGAARDGVAKRKKPPVLGNVDINVQPDPVAKKPKGGGGGGATKPNGPQIVKRKAGDGAAGNNQKDRQNDPGQKVNAPPQPLQAARNPHNNNNGCGGGGDPLMMVAVRKPTESEIKRHGRKNHLRRKAERGEHDKKTRLSRRMRRKIRHSSIRSPVYSPIASERLQFRFTPNTGSPSHLEATMERELEDDEMEYFWEQFC